MRSILLVVLKNIKKKKLQNLLIAIIICVSALVLSTGAGMLQNLNSPVDKVFKDLNTSQTVLYIPDGLYNIEEIRNWWVQQPGVSGVTVYPSYVTNTKITINGTKVDKTIRFSEREDKEAVQDKLMIVSGDKKNSPANGEVWIPTGFAYSYNVKVGDIINIPTDSGDKPVRVSAVVVDPHSSSSFMGTVRFWIASGEANNIFNSRSGDNTIMGISYADYNKAGELWKSFEKYLKAPFGGYMMGLEDYEGLYTDLFKISASILVIFSLIVILCAVLVIAFTISNAILSDFKVIGILKAQGFTSGQIQTVYQIQFLAISLISAPIGVLGSYFCINIITVRLLKAIGINSLHASMLIPFIITLVVILAVTALAANISSRKAGKVKPSDAIKSGAPEESISTGRHTSLLKLKKLSLPISLGVKQAVTYKRQSLFIMSTLLLTAFIFSGTINAYNTLLHLGENLPYWGLDNSEVTVEFPIGVDSQYSKSFVGDMKKDDRVESILPWCWSRASYRTTDGNSKILETMAYDGDMDALGITNLRGRNPRTKDEVSLAVNTCKDMKKDVGDFVDIYLQGVKKTLLVTGVYQSTMDGGTGFRFQMKTMEGLAGSYDTILYSIKLKEGNDPAAFINSLQSSYGRDIDARRTYEIYKGFLTSTIDNLSYALIFLFLVFTVVSFIIVFNITLITIYQQKKDLGIFKALGMTNPQIRNVIACKTLTAGLTGILIGIPFGILVTPRLMNLASSGMGIVNLPFTISLPGTFGVILLSIFIALIGVWIASRKVTQIKLNNLINE